MSLPDTSSGSRMECVLSAIASGQWRGNNEMTESLFFTLVGLGGMLEECGCPTFIARIHELFAIEEDPLENLDWNVADQVLVCPQNASAILNQRGGGLPLSSFFECRPEYSVHVRRFNLEGRAFQVRFQNMDRSANVAETVRQVLDQVIATAFDRSDQRASTRIGLTITHPGLNRAFLLPFTTEQMLTGEKVVQLLLRVLQSAEDFSLDNQMQVTVTRIVIPQGAGRKDGRGCFNSWLEKHSKHGGCFVRIVNNDKLCCARALVVALGWAQSHTSVEARRYYEKLICRSRSVGARNVLSEQTMQARRLMIEAGLNINKECTVKEVKYLEQALLDRGLSVQVKVFCKESFDAIVYEGRPADMILNLYLHDGHFDVLKSVPSLIGDSYFCHACNKGYSNLKDHRCKAVCKRCEARVPCKAVGQPKTCTDCNLSFVSQACFDRHKQLKKNTSVCARFKLCLSCGKCYQVRQNRKHLCFSAFCRICNVQYRGTHFCYMQPIKQDSNTHKKATKANKKRKHDDLLPGEGEHDPDSIEAMVIERETENVPEATQTYVFFDFETRQNDTVQLDGTEYEHKPILVYAQKCCAFCYNTEAACPHCGKQRLFFWYGETCLNEFGDWLFGGENKNAICLAHNLKSYDGQFIMQYLMQQGIIPEIIPKGNEIMSIKAAGIKFIDSINFVNMPLDKIPKSFGLTELKKGFFPYTFFEGLDYVGDWPSADFYQPQFMKPEKKAAFEKWYPMQQGKVFDFKQELLSYCKSDVIILAQGLMRFRQLFMEVTGGIDPLAVATTIASACSYVFRSKYLQPKSIGIIPENGYRSKTRWSTVSIKWLMWMSHTENKQIKHARNGGEAQVLDFFVDGLVDNVVYEFQGCAFHGCPKCFRDRSRLTPFKNLTMEEAYNHTQGKSAKIREAGYNLVEMWECDLNRELKENPQMKQFFDECEIVEPLNPRHAFYGGRTNATKLYHKCESGQQIGYVDFCSLYPFISKYGEFPTGHPTIYTENFKPLTDKPYRGLIKCDVLPPTNLYHPVLPYRSGVKLTFPLCATCAESHMTKCTHSNAERVLKGTWTTLEIYKALELGYQVVKIHEVWHYGKWLKYDGKDPKSGLFSEYIDCFAKLKLESSGFPAWVKTEEDQTQYIEDCFVKEGIRLENVSYNAGLRLIAKLSLNSFWGKFGQRNNLGQLTYFKDPAPFYELLLDDTQVVSSVTPINQEMIVVAHCQDTEFVDSLPNTNVIVAAYTTSQARLHLYNQLELLQERVLYMDTDSLIYLKDPSGYEPPIGQYLGELTNELEELGPNAYIDEFVSGGPKNYAFMAYNPDTQQHKPTVKIRGFSLTSHVAAALNFDRLKQDVFEFVQDNTTNITSVTYPKIVKTGLNRKIVTKQETKQYKVVYDKRVVLPDFSTVAYGYTR